MNPARVLSFRRRIVAVFTGTDCTCTLDGCTCVNETYAHCESQLMPI